MRKQTNPRSYKLGKVLSTKYKIVPLLYLSMVCEKQPTLKRLGYTILRVQTATSFTDAQSFMAASKCCVAMP